MSFQLTENNNQHISSSESLNRSRMGLNRETLNFDGQWLILEVKKEHRKMKQVRWIWTINLKQGSGSPFK